MDNLKPCPFCGGEAKIKENGAEYNYISCKRCKNGTAYGYQDQVIARWNTRAERTCHDDNIGGSFVCSECGANVEDTYVGRSYVDKFGKRWYATSSGQAFNYCPNCGAKVVPDGGE